MVFPYIHLQLPILFSLSENETVQSKGVTETAECGDAPLFRVILLPSVSLHGNVKI